jgi:hypothetical protein
MIRNKLREVDEFNEEDMFDPINDDLVEKENFNDDIDRLLKR